MKKLFSFTKLLAVFLILFGITQFASAAQADAVDHDTLAVTSITPVRTSATTGGGFDNGWKWTYNVTVPDNQPIVKMKFSDWTNETSKVLAANNVRIYSTQSSNAFDAKSALVSSGAGVYSNNLFVNPKSDLSESSGLQIQITVEIQVPTGTASGNYSGTYGVISSRNIPSLSIPENQSFEATGETNTPNISMASATDTPFSTPTLTYSPHAFVVGKNDITWTATSYNGNTNVATSVVVINDITKPTISSHESITQEATSSEGAIVTFTSPSVSDLVDGTTSSTCSPVSGSTFALGTTKVTCTATDAHKNSADPVSFDVKVVDTTAPILSNNEDIHVDATSSLGTEVKFDVPSAKDLVDETPTVECSSASGDLFPIGTTAVTCTATDNNSNTSKSTFDVVVSDMSAPVISSHEDVTVEATSASGAIVNYENPIATDNVDKEVRVTCLPASGSTFKLETTEVDCSAKDNSGNKAESTKFNVIVIDTKAPTITAPENKTVEANGLSTVITDIGTPTVSDVVDNKPTTTNDAPSTYPLGTTTVTWTATDAHGNHASAKQVVTVVDTQKPNIKLIGSSSVTVAQGGKYIEDGATAMDTIDGDLKTVITGKITTETIGDYTLTYTATDKSGNFASIERTVHVTDQTAPIITITGENPATVAQGSEYIDEGATATDNVDSEVKVTASSTVNTNEVGTYSVTYDAVDNTGNKAESVSRTVIVVDKTAPKINPVDDITLEVFGKPIDLTNTATDNIDASVEVTIDKLPDFNNVGDYIITYNAKDSAGNEATPVTRHVHIVPRKIIVTANSQTKVFGDKDPVLSYEVTSGALYGTDEFSGSLSRDQGENVGRYGITLGTLSLGTNYSLSLAPETVILSITPLEVNISIMPSSFNKFTYDGNPKEATLDPLPAGVTAEITYNGSTTAPTHAGTYSVVATVTDSNHTGTSDKGELIILPATATVEATADTKVYDQKVETKVTLSTTGTGADVLTATGTYKFGDKNVGEGKTVAITNIQLSGTNASDYTTVSSLSATYNVTPAPLLVTATAKDKQYDNTNQAEVTFTTDAFDGDDVTVNGDATFDSKNVGENKTVTINNISLAGVDHGNYIPNTSTTTSASISKSEISITGLKAESREYNGGTDVKVTGMERPILVDSKGSPIPADNNIDVVVTSGAPHFNDKNADTDKEVVLTYELTGLDKDNFRLNQPKLTADISPSSMHLVATVKVGDKEYDGNTSATIDSCEVSGMISGDIVTCRGGSAQFEDRNVGIDKKVNVSGLIQDGDDNENYNIDTETTTTATITPRPITVTAQSDTRVFIADDTSSNKTPILSEGSIVDGDTANFTQSFDTPEVGTGKTLTPSGSVNDGNNGNNYLVTTIPDSTGEITAAPFYQDLRGDYTITFSDGGNQFVHSMTIDSEDLATGQNITGSGIYSDPNFTWTLTGNTINNSANFSILYTGAQAGSIYDLIGTISGNGDISGTATGGLTFTAVKQTPPTP